MVLANIAFPWLWPHWRLAMLLLTGCMLAESLLIRPLVSTSYAKALAAAVAVNSISPLVGWPLRLLAEWMLIDPAGVPMKYVGGYLYFILFCLTVLIEWPLYRHFLKLAYACAFPVSLAVNSLSYLLLEFSLGFAYRTAG